MHILGNKSDVRQRAAEFESLQAETLARLGDPDVVLALGDLVTDLTTYLEQAEPVGINKRSEIVMPKTTDLSKPLFFMTRKGETGEFIIPDTTFRSDNPQLRYYDGYTTKGNHKFAITPHTTSGSYYSVRVAEDQGRGRTKVTFPTLLRVRPLGRIGHVGHDAGVMGHELEHWRFMADQDHMALGPVPYGIIDTATEKGAYAVNAAFEPPLRGVPKAETIAREIRRRNITDPEEAAKHALRMVDSRLHTSGANSFSRHREAQALSQVFGDGSAIPTTQEEQAYRAAELIDAD